MILRFSRWLFCRKSAPSRMHRALPRLEVLGARILPSANILQYDNANASTGVNSAEIQLTPVNVNHAGFGKLYNITLDGEVYAQPLVKTGVTIATGPNTTSGSAGVHNVVFVATEDDSLYAIDSSYAGGKILWQRSFINVHTSSNTYGVGSVTDPVATMSPLSSGDVNSNDIRPTIGITGTPVIDPSSNTLYVVADTKEKTKDGTLHFVQRLHAINLTDGTDRVNPFLIGDTTNGNTNHTPIYTYGNGQGSVTDPYNGTGRPVDQFNALRENQRSGLSLKNGTVYAAWASHGDNGPYHGWVVSWNVSHLQSQGMVLSGALNTSPNGGAAGIWQGGGTLAFEPSGSAFYFETGNGFTATGSPDTSNPVLNAQGFPSNADYDNALVKVTADPTSSATHQNANGWGLKVADYFIPYNTASLDRTDEDFGSGGTLVLPSTAGIPGHPNLMLAAGKEGKIYLLDRDNLGKFDPNGDHVVNAVPNGKGQNTPPVLINGSFSTPTYYSGRIYWIDGSDTTTHVFQINRNGTLTQQTQTPISGASSHSGSVFISAYTSANAILWTMDLGNNEIHAFDASNASHELWNSAQASGGADNPGEVIKFAVPTVANGSVYVGTAEGLVVYGLKPPASAAPLQPTLSVSDVSSSEVKLTWTDPTRAPNTATGYRIDVSTDDVHFKQIALAGADFRSLNRSQLSPGTRYYYRIQSFNNKGTSPYSNTAQVVT